MKVQVEFEWDDEKMSQGWFNIYNLELLLYSKIDTRRELLKINSFKELKPGEPREIRICPGVEK